MGYLIFLLVGCVVGLLIILVDKILEIWSKQHRKKMSIIPTKKYASVADMLKDLDKEIKAHPIRHWVERTFWTLVRFPRKAKLELKTFIQRGKRGYGDSDVWGFCDYLTNVILGGLKQLRKNKCGYPATLNPKTDTYDYDEKRWERILDNMIYTFETSKKILDNYPEKDWLYTPTDEWEKRKDVRDAFKDGKTMKVMTKEECLFFEEGWKLFSKNFFSLWD